MKIRWEVKDRTSVHAKIGGRTKSVLTVNGRTIPNKLSSRTKKAFEFALDDGRKAVISVTPQFGTRAVVELRVDGCMMAEPGKNPVVCAK